MKKISFYTLGCKSNQYETSALMRQAQEKGFEISDFNCSADICIINTCTVTQLADRKSRRAIRQARKTNPNAKVIVTGCYAEMAPEEIPEADLIIRNRDKGKILRYIKSENTVHGTPNTEHRVRIRENLMIEDGCEEYCRYCIVPYARGKVRSKPIREAVEEAKNLVNAGAKEIVLTGINLGAYGSDQNQKPKTDTCLAGRQAGFVTDKRATLPFLINQLSKINGLIRIRLSSIESMYITDELIEAIRENPKVCKHLHVPLQSGSTRTLKAMGRRYTAQGFKSLIKKIRRHIPDISLNTDVIVGFPGETEADFKESVSLIKALKFTRIHPFHFSPRPGTTAYSLKGQVDPKTMRKRSGKMHDLRLTQMKKFAKASKKGPQEVLVEGRDKTTGLLEGLTESYIRILFKGEDSLIGGLVKVKIKTLKDEHVVGRMI